LAIEMVVFGLIMLGLAYGPATRESTLRAPYLLWLDDATSSFVDDVRAGRRRLPTDVALAMAVDGSAAATAGPLLAAEMTALFVAMPVAFAVSRAGGMGGGGSHWVSTGSSSCSSSSCGGG